MICRFCGKKIDDNSTICKYCANPVVNEYKEITKSDLENLNNDKNIKNETEDYKQQMSNEISKQETNNTSSTWKKVLGIFSIVLIVGGYLFLRTSETEYHILGMITVVLGILGFVKYYVPNMSNRINIGKYEIQQKEESPEEIARRQAELQAKREKSNKKSISYAKISLWLNGIAGIVVLLCEFIFILGIDEVFGNNRIGVEIPEKVYLACIFLSIPAMICHLTGLIYGLASNDMYNKNKISKVAGVISVIMIVSQVGIIFLIMLYFFGSCISSCPG